MLYKGFDGSIVRKELTTAVVDKISPEIILERMVNAGYSYTFSRLVVTGQLNLNDKEVAIELAQKLGRVMPLLK